jgi:hypothetical protein
MIGSKKYPTERDKGHSCVIGPPEMIPGLRSMAVPVDQIYLDCKQLDGATYRSRIFQ